jgi:hypothetical protein
LIGAAPIYRPGKAITETFADKSAPTNLPLSVVKLHYRQTTGLAYKGQENRAIHPFFLSAQR